MISASQKGFLRALGTHIGTIVGVGVFGLPYVFHQAGSIVGLIELVVVTVMTVLITLMYAEITIQTPGRHRFVSYIGRFLGPSGRVCATIVYVLALFGSFMAFTVVGGEFLNTLIPALGPSVAVVLVALIAGLFSWVGMRFVAKMEVGVIALILFLYALIILVSLPKADFSTLLVVSSHPLDLIAPYGVIFFALFGLSAIPEVHDLLGRNTRQMSRVVITTFVIVGALYAAFALAVVAASGSHTSPDALSGLGYAVSPAVVMIGMILGLISILSVFTESGIQFIETLEFDLRFPRGLAWLLAFGLPVVLYFLGLREFVQIAAFVGSVIGGLTSILVVLAYEKMKRTLACPVGHCWRIPSIVSVILFFAALLGIIAQIVYTIG